MFFLPKLKDFLPRLSAEIPPKRSFGRPPLWTNWDLWQSLHFAVLLLQDGGKSDINEGESAFRTRARSRWIAMRLSVLWMSSRCNREWNCRNFVTGNTAFQSLPDNMTPLALGDVAGMYFKSQQCLSDWLVAVASPPSQCSNTSLTSDKRLKGYQPWTAKSFSDIRQWEMHPMSIIPMMSNPTIWISRQKYFRETKAARSLSAENRLVDREGSSILRWKWEILTQPINVWESYSCALEIECLVLICKNKGERDKNWQSLRCQRRIGAMKAMTGNCPSKELLSLPSMIKFTPKIMKYSRYRILWLPRGPGQNRHNIQ